MTAVGFLFAGEDSVAPAAGVRWAAHPTWRLAAEAAAATGIDTAHLLLHAPGQRVGEGASAQVAAVLLGLMARDALAARGVVASWHLGQGAGALAALAAAGSVGPADAFRLAQARGAAMADAHRQHPGGTIAIVGLDDELVAGFCAMTTGGAWVARYDAPRQVLVSGTAAGVGAVAAVAKAEGAQVRPATVDLALHCPLLAPAAAPLADAFGAIEWWQPVRPVLSELIARPYPAAVGIPQVLAAEVCSPSRWRQAVARGAALSDGPAAGVLVALGAGAGRLAAQAEACAPGWRVLAVEQPEDVVFVANAIDAPASPVVPAAYAGEQLSIAERLVVSPAAGRFAPDETAVTGGRVRCLVRAGQVLGRVGDCEVQSQFSGELMGILAKPGERVTAGQPIAWMRV